MFHYTSCGLQNIWLVNGYQERETSHGKAVAISDLDGLHQAIAHHLIRYKPALSGGEFRFLRKELDLSQGRIANYFGVTEQSVSLWERRGRVPKRADRIIRALNREVIDGNVQLRKMMERLSSMDQIEHQMTIELEDTADGWRAKVA